MIRKVGGSIQTCGFRIPACHTVVIILSFMPFVYGRKQEILAK